MGLLLHENRRRSLNEKNADKLTIEEKQFRFFTNYFQVYGIAILSTKYDTEESVVTDFGCNNIESNNIKDCGDVAPVLAADSGLE